MLPPEFRSVGMVLLLLLTAVTSFLAGVVFVRLTGRRPGKPPRTEHQLTQLVTSLTTSLEATFRMCEMLATAPHLHRVTSRLDGLRSRAAQLVDRFDDAQSRAVGSDPSTGEPAAPGKPTPPAPPREVDLQAYSAAWIRESCDPLTGLPDRSAFLANLAVMMNMAADTGTTAGLLMVRVDRYDHLTRRYGPAGANILTRKLSSVLIHAARDEDLVCRYDQQTFIILQPAVDFDTAVRLAEVIRDSVRHFHFRIEESRPEVLLTCSFGHTLCEPPENGDLLINRAANALARSQRKGRNQLHSNQGAHTLHCVR